MIIESTIATKLAFVCIWAVGTTGFYYLKYGKSKTRIKIMSVANVEKKYKRLNETNKESMF